LALAEKRLDFADRAHRLSRRFGAMHRDQASEPTRISDAAALPIL
jgi:hypothetical protein